jgi:hypothetical protein
MGCPWLLTRLWLGPGAASSARLQVAKCLVLTQPQGRREDASWVVGWCWACEWERQAGFGLLLGRPTLLGQKIEERRRQRSAL